ncbi:MAG: hypothetical protein ACRCZ1_06860 [Cetobacterium sp.]
MLKIDRVEQNVELNENFIYYTSKENDYTLTILDENNAILKTNCGKSLNENGINIGAEPIKAEQLSDLIIKRLELKLLSNKTIEYCIDIETNFKLVENKHIINTFLKTLELHKYKSGKLDFRVSKNKNIQKSDWKGIKGYKKSRAIKLYSKNEEQEIELLESDLIRIELILNARAIEQNNILKISDVESARIELKEFLLSMRATISKVNRYSKNTVYLIEKALLELE